MKKGPLAEKLVVDYLAAHGFPFAERRVMGGANDKGDVSGIVGWVLEVKNQAKMALASWVDEAALEAENAKVDQYAVVHKRTGRGDPGEWYVTLPLKVFAQVIR